MRIKKIVSPTQCRLFDLWKLIIWSAFPATYLYYSLLRQLILHICLCTLGVLSGFFTIAMQSLFVAILNSLLSSQPLPEGMS
jgi:hypothetical protein